MKTFNVTNKVMNVSSPLKQYSVITGNYWAFTLTDGALRMMVVLHFHQLGYSPLQIAALFLFYEVFGIVTNLLGGYLGARIGLNRTMNIGLGLQILALALLAVPTPWLSIPLVMGAQALSGIAKDLNKMSAKSAIKQLVPTNEQSRLFKWVALLTGSKNALKGVGFFLGGALLSSLGFQTAVLLMAAVLGIIWISSLALLKQDLGKAKRKPKFTAMLSRSRAINYLSAARLFLFGARDIWFVVALPVFLSSELGWNFWQTGGLLAVWVIAYGFVQSIAPKILRSTNENPPVGRHANRWALVLAGVTVLLALALSTEAFVVPVLLVGLFLFGIVFAINSALHSYLIVSYARDDGASLDVGFYYMANAAGRLVGTLLSGWIYQSLGFIACLWFAALFILVAFVISLKLPRSSANPIKSI